METRTGGFSAARRQPSNGRRTPRFIRSPSIRRTSSPPPRAASGRRVQAAFPMPAGGSGSSFCSALPFTSQPGGASSRTRRGSGHGWRDVFSTVRSRTTGCPTHNTPRRCRGRRSTNGPSRLYARRGMRCSASRRRTASRPAASSRISPAAAPHTIPQPAPPSRKAPSPSRAARHSAAVRGIPLSWERLPRRHWPGTSPSPRASGPEKTPRQRHRRQQPSADYQQGHFHRLPTPDL